ncbi:prophage tail fiber N-terminal domain-containing protein [Enterobacter kobei]|uniref:prophage tail fiber N-terminal domain-containing protein n=1 Tax=Enterobacter kobei TaxID=208224 RepID=UPI000793DA79|nr:prophage tail fiber N-terminal domain-containing protein [Enterobacter kobei]SAF46806.1 Prophage tail fibre N-terminal [Enterobacter kobei]
MPLTIIISGTYLDPLAQPLPGVTLTFESLYNSSQTQLRNTVKTVTAEDASYSIALVPNYYSVCQLDGQGRSLWLGNIQIFADSPPGSLNEYLTAFKTDQAQPGILAEMEVILAETKKAAAASSIPEFEAPGFIGFFSVYTNSATIRFNPGDEVAASQLSYSGISDPAAFMIQSSTHPAGGTWRCLGFAGYQGQSNGKAVIPFQRVDTLPPQPVQKLRGSRTGVRNCTYSAPDESMIDCEVFMGGRWRPFTACAGDNTVWGKEIFRNALAGLYGTVIEFTDLKI